MQTNCHLFIDTRVQVGTYLFSQYLSNINFDNSLYYNTMIKKVINSNLNLRYDKCYTNFLDNINMKGSCLPKIYDYHCKY